VNYPNRLRELSMDLASHLSELDATTLEEAADFIESLEQERAKWEKTASRLASQMSLQGWEDSWILIERAQWEI